MTIFFYIFLNFDHTMKKKAGWDIQYQQKPQIRFAIKNL